jgi:hypothetical protein
MNDNAIYDEDFFASQERPKPLRKQVKECIDRVWATTGTSHSMLWRKAYLDLEERTGFRVPDIKSRLDAVEKAGLMEQMLEVVKSQSAGCGDHTSEVNKAIPDFVPHRSPERRTVSIQHDPIEVTPYMSPHPHRNREQRSEEASA